MWIKESIWTAWTSSMRERGLGRLGEMRAGGTTVARVAVASILGMWLVSGAPPAHAQEVIVLTDQQLEELRKVVPELPDGFISIEVARDPAEDLEEGRIRILKLLPPGAVFRVLEGRIGQQVGIQNSPRVLLRSASTRVYQGSECRVTIHDGVPIIEADSQEELEKCLANLL
jgi:hypothetical protein